MPLSAAASAREILTGLHEVMAGRGSAQVKLDKVVDLIAEAMASEVCSIYLLRDNKLELFATHGLRKEAVHVTRLGMGEGLVGTIAADDEADAIRIANDSEFGLGSGVLTGDLDRGRRIASLELEAGMSFVNENVRSDSRMPFGGVKHSGYGRECASFGIREFTNIKSVHVSALKPTGGKTVE